MSQKTLNLCLERYNFVKFGETTKSSHTVLCINNAYSVNSDKYRLTPTAIASKHGDGYVFTLNYDFDRPLFTIVQKSYSLDGTSGNIVFEGIDPISKGGSKYLRKVTVSPVKLSDGSYLLEVTNDEYLRIGTTGAALGDEDLESLNEKIVAMGGIEKSVENVGGKQVLKLDASGSTGAKEIVYFDVDPSDPPSGIYEAIGEALANNKEPVIRNDGAVYFYSSTGTDKYVFVGGYDTDVVNYTTVTVSDDDSVVKETVDTIEGMVFPLYYHSNDGVFTVADKTGHALTKTEIVNAYRAGQIFMFSSYPASNTQAHWGYCCDINIDSDNTGYAMFFILAAFGGDSYRWEKYRINLSSGTEFVTLWGPNTSDSTGYSGSYASAADVTALQSQVSSLSDVSAYTVKGEATVAQLNAGPSGIQAGWAYQLTDSGTLTDGNLAVVAGDTVAWDGTKWFPLVKSDYYATKTYAQNVAHSIAPEFDPTRDEDHKYLAGEKVIYNGKSKTFIVDHYGAWSDSDAVDSDSIDSVINNVSQRVSGIEKYVYGFSVVFEKSAVWGSSSLNSKWIIGSLYAEKTLSILVTCENPPQTSVTIYFSTGSGSGTIINSETKTATIGTPLEVIVPSAARYIWVFNSNGSATDKDVTLQLLDVNSAGSLESRLTSDIDEVDNRLSSSIKSLDIDVNSATLITGTATWASTLDTGAKFFDSDYAGKLASILVTCENPPQTSVTIYFSTGSGSGTIINSETKTATIGTPLEVVIPATARYIWVFNDNAGGSVSVSYSVTYVGDLTDRVQKLEGFKSSLPAIHCEVSSNSVQIKRDLDNGRKQRIVFYKFGPSQIMQLRSVAVYGSNGEILSAKNTGTDSLGPYVVRAVNNADGTNMNSPFFTGGCHGYNGDQTGAATASCEVKVVADGKEISSGSCDCLDLSVIVTNKIQGWNTRKSDGTGREIIQESISYKIDSSSDKILVSSEIKALEDVVFESYYGLQMSFARDAIRFTCGEFSEWRTTEYPSYSGDTLDSVDGKSTDGFYQEMGLYPNGLGHFAYTGDNPKAFRSNTKGYYSLIRSDVNVSAGNIIRLAGYYSFDFIGTEVVPIKFGSFDINNTTTDKYFSIADLPEGTYKLKYYLSGENNGSGVVSIYTASSHSSSGIINTYANVSPGTELIINITSNTKIIWFYNSSTAKTELSYALYQ